MAKIDVSFDSVSGDPVYRVKTHRGNLLWEDTIDANSGVLVGGSISSFVSKLTKEDHTQLTALNNVQLDLADAIVVSEKDALGREISGGLSNEDGRTTFRDRGGYS